MPAERLSKVLAAAGVASRRGADELIAAGRVTVDGRPAVLGERVDPDAQRIEVSGRPVRMPEARPIHLAVHKPIGVTSTVRDRHAERTHRGSRPGGAGPGRPALPVGRLDQDSEGLILVTNDGAWAERVLHPRYGVEREYAIGLACQLTRDQAYALETGVELAEGVATVTGLRGQTNTEDRPARGPAGASPGPPAGLVPGDDPPGLEAPAAADVRGGRRAHAAARPGADRRRSAWRASPPATSGR